MAPPPTGGRFRACECRFQLRHPRSGTLRIVSPMFTISPATSPPAITRPIRIPFTFSSIELTATNFQLPTPKRTQNYLGVANWKSRVITVHRAASARSRGSPSSCPLSRSTDVGRKGIRSRNIAAQGTSASSPATSHPDTGCRAGMRRPSCRCRRSPHASNVQCIEGQASRVGIRWRAAELGPAAARFLLIANSP